MIFFRPKEGVEWSREALDREMSNNQQLLSRCLLYQGIGYHLQGLQAYVRKDKEEFQKNALNSLMRLENHFVTIIFSL